MTLPIVHPYKYVAPNVGSNTSLWNPGFLSQIIVGWFDAKDSSTVTLNSGNVSAWRSKLGTMTATQSTAANQPGYTSGVSLNFNAANLILNVGSSPTVYDVIFVGTPLASNSSNFRTALYSSSNGMPLLLNTNTNNAGYYGSTGFVQYGTESWVGTNIQYISVPASTKPFSAFNGSELATAGSSTLSTTNIVNFGNNPSYLNAQFFGSINKILIFSRQLTTSERQLVEGWAAWDCGIQNNLPTNHPFYAAPPLAPQLWTPAQLGGSVAAWFDASVASSITLNGQNVSSWASLVGSTVLTRATSANQPAFVGSSTTNNKPAVKFTSSSATTLHSTVTISGSNLNTFLSGVTTTSTASGGRIVSLIGSTGYDYNTDGFIAASVYSGPNISSYKNSATTPNIALTTNSQFVFESIYNGTNINDWVNGTTNTTVSATGSVTLTGLNLGGVNFSSTSAYYFDGNISEVIIVTQTLTALQIALLEGYLAWKWGTQASLPSSHPYYAAPPFVPDPVPYWSLDPSAIVDFDFVKGQYFQVGVGSGTIPGTFLTTSRASSGTAFDSAGNFYSFAANIPRIIPLTSTNYIRNNTMLGAVAGTPGTLPTNWSYISGYSIGNGISQTIVGTGTENGFTYVDIQYSGTSTSALNFALGLEQPNIISATINQNWTQSVIIRISGGSTSNITFNLQLCEFIGSAYSTSNLSSISLTSTSQRFSVNRTLTGSTTNNVVPVIQGNFSSGVAINITLRISVPQLELGGVLSPPIATSSAAVTVNNAAGLGLLVEESRTNSITSFDMSNTTYWTQQYLNSVSLGSSNFGNGNSFILNTSGSVYANINQIISLTQNNVYTLSCYVLGTTGAAVFPGMSVVNSTEFAVVINTNNGTVVQGTWGYWYTIFLKLSDNNKIRYYMVSCNHDIHCRSNRECNYIY